MNIRTLHHMALPVSAVSGMLAGMLFYFGYGDFGQYVALFAALALVYGANLDRENRHRQWAFPIMSILFLLIVAGVLAWGRGEYVELLQKYDHLIRFIERWLNVTIPRDIVNALALINGLLLFLWGTLKLTLNGIVLFLNRILPSHSSSVSFGAYAFRPQRGWFLSPQWHFARHFLLAMTFLSLILLIASWQIFVGVMFSSWVPMLPAAMVVILGEISAYLGGHREAAGGVIFGGEDTNAKPWANYEKPWGDLRRVWTRQWLAAGNNAPWSAR